MRRFFAWVSCTFVGCALGSCTLVGCARDVVRPFGDDASSAPSDAQDGDKEEPEQPPPGGDPGNNTGDDDDTPPPPAPAVTYYEHMMQLFERSCHACHTPEGVAPFSFDNPLDAQSLAPLLLEAIEGGIMPPYHARQECNETRDDTRFSEDEKALLREWIELGAPLGDPADAVHADVVAVEPLRRDVVKDIGVDFNVMAVMESAADTDVYRCFDVDLGFATDTAIVGYEVTPGNVKIVHHLLGYIVPPDKLNQLQNNDDNDPGAGYGCESAGVGIDGAFENLGVSWVPGAGTLRMPEGTGIMVPAGSHLVVQIHYNVHDLTEGAIDRTSFALETQAPEGLEQLFIIPVANFGIDIPAGDPNSVQTMETGIFYSMVFQNTRIFAATGHMHQLGTAVRLDVVRAGGEDECVFETTWDFHWQRSYALAEPLEVGPFDRMKITCVYDNSAENQPIIGGVQQEPRDVQWGEGSLDEMCMVYLSFTAL